MANCTILSDLHIGVERSSGTTLQSRLLLRQSLLTQFKSLLPESDLILLGDVFDKYIIPVDDLFSTYSILREWLTKGFKLVAVNGNHDTARTSNTMSSFDLLCKLLQGVAGSQITVVKERGQSTPYGYIIPHCQDQTLFEQELEKVPECDYLFVHCNIANIFATHSDQSLNMSLEQITACKARKIICAHEHHGRQFNKVTLPGSQVATSVSDWLAPGDKQFASITDGELTLTTCLRKTDEYIEIPWDALVLTPHRFVRVIGFATADQASQTVTKISKFREKSPALVVSNAVNIESMAGLGDFNASLESVQAFDCWKALEGVLEPSEIALLKGLE